MALSEDKRDAFKYGFMQMDALQRSWALVGYYMQQFSMLENEVDLCMDTVLKLKPFAMTVLGRHLEASAKVKVLRSFVDMIYAAQPYDSREILNGLAVSRKRTEGVLKTLQEKHLDYRNMVAHSTFQPEEEPGDGVTFISVKANSRLKIEDVSWGVSTFFDRTLEMQDMREGLRLYRQDARNSSFHALLDVAFRQSIAEMLDDEADQSEDRG